MTFPIPLPWCLHWGRDGELADSDRQELFRALARNERGLARQWLAQAPLDRRHSIH